MISIQLQYPGKPKQVFLPQGFEELSEEKYIKAIALMKRAETEPTAQWLLLLYLSGLQVKDMEILNAVQRVELLSQMEFLYDTSKLPSKCMIKKVSAKNTKGSLALLGPGDVLRHLTFGEFIAAETRLERYEKSGDPGELNQFLGILYRPADKARSNYADKRQPFNEQLIAHYGQFFEMVDANLKVAILMNYHGMKQMLPRLFSKVYPKPKNEQAVKSESEKLKKTQTALNWLKILSSMAERDVTKYPDIKATPMHEALFNLNEAIDSDQKAKAELENAKRK